MKRLFLFLPVLFALCACSRDAADGSKAPSAASGGAPRFYGVAMLDAPAPETRGVADGLKVWSRPVAKEQLTVKFLNGTERYREFVKKTAVEWEKYADVKFRFVDDDQNALIRIGFDYVRGMQSSWALTGTDHARKFSAQDEATVHFAQWRRASDAAKRSDVLRAFGQVLGLELEFRHPGFYPEWIVDAGGNIDEATIRDYWENELAELITWEELKKVVLDPLSSQTFLISKTDEYDPNSVMTWPFYEMIANNIPVVEFDEDYRTELSAQDKAFIETLYGKPEPESRPEDRIGSHLVSFDYAWSTLDIALTMSRQLAILELLPGAEEPRVVARVTIPDDAARPYRADLSLQLGSGGPRKIIIAELLKYGESDSNESYALEGIDLKSGDGIEHLDLQAGIPNRALTYLRVIGNGSLPVQHFDFTGNETLKELYLVRIGDSKVTLANCPALEVFATTKYLCRLDLKASGLLPDDSIFVPSATPGDGAIEGFIVREPCLVPPVGMPADSLGRNPQNLIFRDSLVVHPTPEPLPAYSSWPSHPEQVISFSGKESSGLTIVNCPKLRAVALENTQLETFDFGNLPNLEYVYLSSLSTWMVGGGTVAGDNLRSTLATLPIKRGTPGQVIVRGVGLSFTKPQQITYIYKRCTFDTGAIDKLVTRRNWVICWDPTILGDPAEN